MRVIIRDVLYETVKDAANAFNLSTNYIYQAISAGRQDIIGLGVGKKLTETSEYKGNVIDLYGVVFPNMTIASAELGLSKTYVRCAIRRKSVMQLDRIKFECLKYASRKEMEKYAADRTIWKQDHYQDVQPDQCAA